jgi:hypothetical protein
MTSKACAILNKKHRQTLKFFVIFTRCRSLLNNDNEPFYIWLKKQMILVKCSTEKAQKKLIWDALL